MNKEIMTLKHPVTVDGEEIAELHLRRPKVGDLKRIQKHKGELEKSIHLLADLAEISPKAVEELDATDSAPNGPSK